MAERMAVRNKVVLVTGAAHGIGLDTAQRLNEKGALVALLDIDADRVQKEAERLGISAIGVGCDVTDRDQVHAAVAAVVERFGRLDVVIPNAGIGRAGALSTMPDDDYRQVVAVNLDGNWNTVRASLPHLVASRGYLLIIASAWSFMNGVGVGAYPMTKAALEAMGRALRIELVQQDVDVGIAYFGFVDTDLVRNAFAHPGMKELRKALPRFISKPMPVARASNAIIAGIERRAPRVTAPGWIAPGLLFRGVLALADRRFTRDRNVQRAVALMRDEA